MTSRLPQYFKPVTHQATAKSNVQPHHHNVQTHSCIIRRINEDTLYLPRKLLLQRLQGQQIIAEDEPVVEDILLRHPLLGAWYRLLLDPPAESSAPASACSPSQSMSVQASAFLSFMTVLPVCRDLYGPLLIPIKYTVIHRYSTALRSALAWAVALLTPSAAFSQSGIQQLR